MKKEEPQKKVYRIYFYFTWFIRIILILALFFEFYNKRWTLFFVTLIALFITFFPIFFQKKYKIFIPPEFNFFIVIFIYAGIYLGEVQNFYTKYWWWDSILHLSSGFALGIIGFILMYILVKSHKIKASSGLIVFLSFCFALAIGTTWEIFEFTIDTIFNLNMQKTHIGTGVTDTMYDLILDSIGALISSIGGYFYLKKGDSKIYKNLILYFENKNPQLFKKIK
ncbi:MAG: hypothetical protein ACOC16_03155 [Nanoarchaeota archaeon]